MNNLNLYVITLCVCAMACKSDATSKQKSVHSKLESVVQMEEKTKDSLLAKMNEDSSGIKTSIDSLTDYKEKEEKSRVETSNRSKKVLPKKQKQPVHIPKPIMVFEKTTHDFGELMEGEKYSHKYVFKNAGNADLQIKSASASCGCTQPSFPFLDIPPDEKGHIGVTYYSVGKEADQTATITVKGNFKQDSIVLFLTGTVLPKETEEEKDTLIYEKQDSIK